MQKILTFILLFSSVFMECKSQKQPKTRVKPVLSGSVTLSAKPPEDEILILFHTRFGDMKARLFNETPRHRDNIVKLIESGFYDSTLFHRVIKNFMIQGGDPDSRTAEPGKKLGDGDTGKWIPAEFLPAKYFHKKGVLAAARESDDINPKKESSGCQFYIVQGKIQDDALLEKNERRINRAVIQKITDSILALPANKKLKYDFDRVKNSQPKKPDSLLLLQKKIDALVDPVYANYPGKYKIPDDERKVYKTIGGTPHLDTHYTVFGEVYEGLDVLDKIIAVETDENDRPKENVRMSVKILRKP